MLQFPAINFLGQTASLFPGRLFLAQ